MSIAPLALNWLLGHEEATAAPFKPDLKRPTFDLKPKPAHTSPQATA